MADDNSPNPAPSQDSASANKSGGGFFGTIKKRPVTTAIAVLAAGAVVMATQPRLLENMFKGMGFKEDVEMDAGFSEDYPGPEPEWIASNGELSQAGYKMVQDYFSSTAGRDAGIAVKEQTPMKKEKYKGREMWSAEVTVSVVNSQGEMKEDDYTLYFHKGKVVDAYRGP